MTSIFHLVSKLFFVLFVFIWIGQSYEFLLESLSYYEIFLSYLPLAYLLTVHLQLSLLLTKKECKSNSYNPILTVKDKNDCDYIWNADGNLLVIVTYEKCLSASSGTRTHLSTNIKILDRFCEELTNGVASTYWSSPQQLHSSLEIHGGWCVQFPLILMDFLS